MTGASVTAHTPETENILVIKLGALGDFVQALGPMQAIRRHHPQASITLLTTKPFVGFGLGCGYFNHVWMDTRPRWNDIGGWLDLRQKLRAGHFTRVYDLQNNDRTSWYLKLFPRKERPEWVGVAAGASHRNTNPERTAGSALAGHIQTLALAGITDITIDRLEWVPGNIDSFMHDHGLKKPYVLLVPGCAPGRTEKRWPAENYGHIARIVDGWGYQPVVIGTQQEADLAEQICTVHKNTLSLVGGTSLLDIALLARHAAGAIGNDTGPMHMIAPTGCPSLVLFSRHSTPHRHAPQGAHVKTHQVDELKDLKVSDVERLISVRWFRNQS